MAYGAIVSVAPKSRTSGFKNDTPNMRIKVPMISAVKNADLILVLDDGILAGAGTHEELLASCEPYQEICHSQERGNEQ